MKRDMELIRKMVLAMEDHPEGHAPDAMDIEGFTGEQIAYHAYLIVDGGLATGTRIDGFGSSGPEVFLDHLTWAGHEFADLSRDESRWASAMGTVKEKGGTVSVGVITQVLSAIARGALGLP
jgi:hypothetical protein